MKLLINFLYICLFITAVQPSFVWAAVFSFEKHWNFPLKPQGEAPENYSDLEKSLYPEDCGICHNSQYVEWSGTRHSQAMGPAVIGQFHAPWLDDKTVITCTNCHAPLAEQSPILISIDGKFKKNMEFIEQLRPRGITCAACHIRKNVRFGPVSRSTTLEDPPHNSFVAVENFGNSSFCKPCHQFNKNDNRVAGKLLQNTYYEWLDSRYGKKGIHCTNCHMPDRRHLWAGIHDPEMVKKGITIDVKRQNKTLVLQISNTGVGHNFPTYVTPKVVIRGAIIDDTGAEILGTVEEKQIGWDIALDLSEEYYDTRIPPDGKFSATFNLDSHRKGMKYRIKITVFPDYFYSNFYKALIENPPDGVDIKKIKEAYSESLKSPYTLYEKLWQI